jgi:hypothetical protein
MEIQQGLFDQESGKFEEWRTHWKGMPEFIQGDAEPIQSVLVHFASVSDRELFASLIGQKISGKTKSVWYPAAEIVGAMDKEWIDEK